MSSKVNTRIIAVSGIVLATAMARLLPHPPNFVPVTALALFSGAFFSSRIFRYSLPLAAMLLSDIVLEIITGYGFHTLQPVIYATFMLITFLGSGLQGKKPSIGRTAFMAFSGNLLFFLTTNFAVWATGNFYPHDLQGLTACYAAGLPFFGDGRFFLNGMAGDLFYTGLLFGAWHLAQRRIPALAQ
jgi:hypothetical protein